MKKGICALLITSSLFFVFSLTSFATTVDEPISYEILTSDSKVTGDFIEFLSPFYQGDYEQYSVQNIAGLDITKEMYGRTIGLQANGDWQSIYTYYLENDLSIERIEYIYNNRGIDIAKRGTKRVAQTLKPISGPNYPLYNDSKISAQISGTIYYNPNTYQINNATSASTDSLSLSERVDAVRIYPSHPSIKGITATLGIEYHCIYTLMDVGYSARHDYIEFAPAAFDLTITAG